MQTPGETASVPMVGRTAVMTASARATENDRPDRLFADPWAAPLLEAYRAAGGDPVGFTGRAGTSELWDFFRLYFPARTPFFDDEVRRAVAGGVRQVVVLAAGLDARAGRLDLPEGTLVYEVDSAPVLEFKRVALAEAGLDVDRRVPVAADLAGAWADALRGAGFRAGEPAVWLVEGLVFYLDTAACDRLLAEVRELCAPGSRVAVEGFNRLPRADDMDELDETDEHLLTTVLDLFDDGPGAPVRDWFAAHGLAVDHLTDVAAEIAAQGREVPPIITPGRDDPFVVWLAAGAPG